MVVVLATSLVLVSFGTMVCLIVGFRFAMVWSRMCDGMFRPSMHCGSPSSLLTRNPGESPAGSLLDGLNCRPMVYHDLLSAARAKRARLTFDATQLRCVADDDGIFDDNRTGSHRAAEAACSDKYK